MEIDNQTILRYVENKDQIIEKLKEKNYIRDLTVDEHTIFFRVGDVSIRIVREDNTVQRCSMYCMEGFYGNYFYIPKTTPAIRINENIVQFELITQPILTFGYLPSDEFLEKTSKISYSEFLEKNIEGVSKCARDVISIYCPELPYIIDSQLCTIDKWIIVFKIKPLLSKILMDKNKENTIYTSINKPKWGFFNNPKVIMNDISDFSLNNLITVK